MKNYIVFSLAFIFSLVSFAQVGEQQRVEFELDEGYGAPSVRTFDEKGVLLSAWKKRNKKSPTYEWKMDFYNTEMELEKTEYVEVSKKLQFDESYKTEKNFHSFFKNKKGTYELITIEAGSLNETRVNGILPKKSVVKDMAVQGEVAYFNATIKGMPYLFSINWKTGDKNMIPIQIRDYSSKKTSIQKFQLLEEEQEIFVYVQVKIDKRRLDYYVVQLSEDGETGFTVNLSKNLDKGIVDATASKVDDQEYVFTGTYKSITRSTRASVYSNSAQGLFFCQVKGKKMSYINYYKFIDMEEFNNHLPKRTKAKLEKKKAKKASRGKELVVNYNIASHEVMKTDEGYLFLGEAYYPTYRTEYRTRTVNGVTTTYTVQVFDGYQYTHATIVHFNFDGEMQWDKAFAMWPYYKPYYVKRFISVDNNEDEGLVKMVFVSHKRIKSMSIDYEGESASHADVSILESSHEGDKVRYSFSNLDYWYGNSFIAFGTQRIKNKTNKNVKKKRTIFFMNKINY